MTENNDEKSVENNDLPIDNEALKNLAGNLLKNEQSLGSIMDLATNLLGKDSLLNSITDQDEKSEENNDLPIDNEALKNLAGNLLKNEQSLGSIMDLATNLLGKDSPLNSFTEQVATNMISQKLFARGDEKQENTFPSVIQNQENFTKDILTELTALSQKLDHFTNISLELRLLSQRLNTITNDISTLRKEMQYLLKQNKDSHKKRRH